MVARRPRPCLHGWRRGCLLFWASRPIRPRLRDKMLTLADVIECFSGVRPVRADLRPIAQPIHAWVIDSRQAQAGDLFVAFKGERADGHNFIRDAFARGAVAALIEQDAPADCDTLDLRQGLPPDTRLAHYPLPTSLSLPVCLRVSNVLKAMQDLSGWWRSKFKIRVIGITGSVGKTSTKELVWTVLSRRFRTLRSEGNLNNEIGVPLTLFGLESTHERVILEMGMYANGEITRLCEIARPSV